MVMEENPHSTRSSPFRNPRQFAMTSGKRAHSPDGSPGDRPSKRLSLATGDVSIGYRHFSTSSANSSRYPSEDWVQQAGGLTINSTIYPPVTHHFPVQAPDVEMFMEPDESGLQPLQPSSCPPPTPVSPPHQHIIIESQLPNTLRRQRYSERIHPPINVLPPTPITFTTPPNKHQSEEQQHPSTRPSTPPNSSPTAMVISSPSTSFSQIPSSSTKRRVFFGPRTGCEKCKLGVKGHFIHSE
ncbi:hypothetical protein BYT27DRAFT_6726717 [Phlegmacium glaucopus]|nr:hypothetical protein BYT27DRAFT_6726717 [Phlegmacium glaucopus]